MLSLRRHLHKFDISDLYNK